ncbi:hypothetical protein [Moorena sp. SIO3I8]|uniref:hypothetical protein n=1 Tax=Moorena sp. SIO3I8 TaxID=2607833 RepID=UPI0013C28040|nr:hypothetical protein [Moorena sp. SIO3I8]NEO05638.1 hypothetical protein [Moorena sp. SIO3I8]
MHQQRIKSYYYSRFPIPDSRFPIPDSRFPIPDSRFPIPDSRFPIPDSRFPIPDSLPLHINFQLGAKSEYCARISKLKQTSRLDIPRLRC